MKGNTIKGHILEGHTVAGHTMEGHNLEAHNVEDKLYQGLFCHDQVSSGKILDFFYL